MLQDITKYITIKEFAKLKGISEWYTRKLCRQGKINTAIKFGRTWFIIKGSEIVK